MCRARARADAHAIDDDLDDDGTRSHHWHTFSLIIIIHHHHHHQYSSAYVALVNNLNDDTNILLANECLGTDSLSGITNAGVASDAHLARMEHAISDFQSPEE